MGIHITDYVDGNSVYHTLSAKQRDCVDALISTVDGCGTCFQVNFDEAPSLMVSSEGIADFGVSLLIHSDRPGAEVTAYTARGVTVRLLEALDGKRLTYECKYGPDRDVVAMRTSLNGVVAFVRAALRAGSRAGVELDPEDYERHCEEGDEANARAVDGLLGLLDA
jgi:hypothetical protein